MKYSHCPYDLAHKQVKILLYTSAITCAITIRNAPMPKLVIYPFDTRQVSMGQNGRIYLLLHDSHQKPNCANLFVTRQESRFRMADQPHSISAALHNPQLRDPRCHKGP